MSTKVTCLTHQLCFFLVQIDALQHTLTATQPGWLGFCHNDLQYGNMLLAAHTTCPQRQSLLPAEGNTTQGKSREDALMALEDPALGSSADLNPMLVDLLSDNLEGLSPRKAGKGNGAFWEGHPSFNRSLSKGREGPASPVSPPVSPKRKEQIPEDPLEALDPTQVLTHAADEHHESAYQPDKLPSQVQPQLQVTTKTASAPADAHIRLIDYEYAGVNPVALDIANHWCEYAADYHTNAPHVLDYNKFPDQEHQAGFIHAYIETVHSMSKKHGDQLSWGDEQVSYSAPAPGAMQTHTDSNCNQSLYSKDAISTPMQGGPGMSHGILADASGSAPAAHDSTLQVCCSQRCAQLLLLAVFADLPVGAAVPVKSAVDDTGTLVVCAAVAVSSVVTVKHIVLPLWQAYVMELGCQKLPAFRACFA